MSTTIQQLKEIKNRDLITADEVIELIGVNRNTLLRYKRNGILKDIKIGGRVFYRVEDVKNYLSGGR